jgi:hypothetical protein
MLLVKRIATGLQKSDDRRLLDVPLLMKLKTPHNNCVAAERISLLY